MWWQYNTDFLKSLYLHTHQNNQNIFSMYSIKYCTIEHTIDNKNKVVRPAARPSPSMAAQDRPTSWSFLLRGRASSSHLIHTSVQWRDCFISSNILVHKHFILNHVKYWWKLSNVCAARNYLCPAGGFNSW